MPCDKINSCPTRETLQALRQKQQFDRKYLLRTENGTVVNPHEVANFAEILLNGEACCGENYRSLPCYKSK